MKDKFKYDLPTPVDKKADFKMKKLQQNRAANALFFGVVLGFVFSFLFAYTGVFDETTTIDYSLYEFMSTSNETNVIVPDKTNLAEYLYTNVRVLCMVLTGAESLEKQGPYIMDTWGKRCNKILFFSNKPNANISNVVVIDQNDSMMKFRLALKYINTHHNDDFDWLFKVTDTSFIILENLRHLLYQYETDWPLYIGQRFLKEDYMIGDFALSRRAYIRLLEDGFTNKMICEERGDVDKEVSKCLEHLNVMKVDGIDPTGRGQFFRTNIESALFPERTDNYDEWYWHKLKQGIDHCCSDRLVSIQNILGTHLYYLEYFIYKVHAFGRHRKREPLPKKLLLHEIVRHNY